MNNPIDRVKEIFENKISAMKFEEICESYNIPYSKFVI